MDFVQIVENPTPKGGLEIYPEFIVKRSRDLMVRGRSFYAIWNDETGMWSTDEYDVPLLIDAMLEQEKKKREGTFNGSIRIKRLSNFSSKMWSNFQVYLKQMSDSYHQLDEKLTFIDTKVKKTDYVSRRLPYALQSGNMDAYEEIMQTLYDPEERAKLEWAVGAIIAGDARDIQKFIVLYGGPGSGKSTFLNIVQRLFVGYYTTFDAKALTSSNNGFSMEIFKNNPMVAIQHDGDLSKIEDNTKLNSIVSHEDMMMNEKYKSSYMSKIDGFLFMGTNKPVKITDAKSGIIRRLIDVNPSLRRIPNRRYHVLMNQIDFELGAIAHHCLEVYRSMGKNFYSSYVPINMMMETDELYNFVFDRSDEFIEKGGVSLKQAYEWYKIYCDESNMRYKMPMYKFREELKAYFETFHDRFRVGNDDFRSYYKDFKINKLSALISDADRKPMSLVLDNETSLLDALLSDRPAQYATPNETPSKKWSDCKTALSNINTKETHYVKPPTQHIVIDFDLTDENGNKSLELNLEAASKWPATYAEFSKSGFGIHLHYIYEGDVSKLSRVYDEGIEIKVFSGNSSLRRRLTKCNNIPVAKINSGLPLKGEKPMINFDSVKSEKGLRDLILRALKKEIHPQGTKPNIDFINKILEDAYNSGLPYDVTDLRPKILAFANNSTNQSATCVKIVSKMKFASEEHSVSSKSQEVDNSLVFFDVEVFKNLFVVVWKKEGKDFNPVKMINPSSEDIESLLNFNLVGFNCRRYDNHILYARLIGKTNMELYEISQKIINGSKNAMFGEAYNISYTDVYDFSSAINKKSLKKWEIELGIHHMELGLKWDEEAPEDTWDKVADYCINDVVATEAVFYHPPIQGDWAARQILAELSGLSVNDTTNTHSTKIVFGNNKKPQSQFIYTDLSEMFPGYVFEHGKSIYRGIETGEGGYVYAEPGMYSNVAVLDVASMHPTSIRRLNMFGPYTQRFNELTDGRIAIKHKDYKTLETLLDGKLVPFVESALGENPKFTLKDLSNGLKTVINSAYGLTSASFDNAFRDPRNKDNIVAKRGALFMVDLQYAVQEKGFTVAHIKTDSIKIPNATQEIIDFVFEFGRKYGYEFEHEETYERFCLVNDAVYIARTDGVWSATGAQFAQPYVFKTLFSKEKIEFADMCETKSVTTALYLDMNEDLGEDEHNYHFVGKTGLFCPIKPGCGGGVLLREKDEKYYAATGSKGYRWMEAEMVRQLGKENDIDRGYYINLVDAAVKDISMHGDFEWFMSDSDEPVSSPDTPIGMDDVPPWIETCQCGKPTSACATCTSCPNGKKCQTVTDTTFDLFKPPCGNDIPCSECSLIDECALLPF